MLYEWIRNLEFAFPYAFGLFALLPFLIWWNRRKAPARQSKMMVSSSHPFLVGSARTAMRKLPFFLRILALCSLIVALARPQLRNDMQKTEGEGIDIVLCMDVSGSMGSRDILPSRMEVAKEMAEEFVRSRPFYRIVLFIFYFVIFSLVNLR
jgi:Ca-activated chloride channel family protein